MKFTQNYFKALIYITMIASTLILGYTFLNRTLSIQSQTFLIVCSLGLMILAVLSYAELIYRSFLNETYKTIKELKL